MKIIKKHLMIILILPAMILFLLGIILLLPAKLLFGGDDLVAKLREIQTILRNKRTK